MVWLIWAMVCLLAAPRVQLEVSGTLGRWQRTERNAQPHISLYQLTTTSETVERCCMSDDASRQSDDVTVSIVLARKRPDPYL